MKGYRKWSFSIGVVVLDCILVAFKLIPADIFGSIIKTTVVAYLAVNGAQAVGEKVAPVVVKAVDNVMQRRAQESQPESINI